MQPIYKTDIFLFFVSFYHIASQFSTETNIRTERCASTTYPTLRPNASFFRFLCAAGDTNVTEILSLHRYGADARTAVPRGTAEETGQTLKHYSHVSKTILPGPRTLRSDGLHRLRQRGRQPAGPRYGPCYTDRKHRRRRLCHRRGRRFPAHFRRRGEIYGREQAKRQPKKSAPCRGRRNSPASHFPTPPKWK